MSNTISAQHPAVVLRSNYRLVRALLAVATIAIVGLTVAVVILAANNSSAIPSVAAHATRSTVKVQVQPNADEQGAAVSPLAGNVSYLYPGHF